MAWELNSNQPIYSQIISKVTLDIISGVYKPGDRLPSVRDLAADAAVNPNTMQKALSELERTGLVSSNRTSGRFITDDVSMIDDLKRQMALRYASDYINGISRLGYNTDEAIALLRNVSCDEAVNEEE